LTRRRIAHLRQLSRKLRAPRRRNNPPEEPDRRTSEELARRLDETRERLRRENPPGS
jgi:hypothetical protein